MTKTFLDTFRPLWRMLLGELTVQDRKTSNSKDERKPKRFEGSLLKVGLLLTGFILTLLFVSVSASSIKARDSAPYKNTHLASIESTNESDHFLYLPTVFRSNVLLIADFNRCAPPNNLGGDMGAACPLAGCPLPNRLIETYEVEEPGNCVIRAEYHIQEWSAFWLKLLHADFTPYSRLVFDLKADATIGVPNKIRIELKRDCQQVSGGTECKEVSIEYVENIIDEWQRARSVALSDFQDTGWPGLQGIQDWSDIEELVFTFEASESGHDGAVFIDNIYLMSGND